jgi:phosphomevalonate kinase
MIMDEMRVSAPGKILWFGGYSILEPNNKGLVTTVNNYVHVNVSKYKEKSILISAPDFDMVYESKVNDEDKLLIQPDEKLKLISKAAEVALKYAIAEGVSFKGIKIESKNDPAFSTKVNNRDIKSGLGSSAAVIVATISSILAYYNFDIYKNRELVHKLAQIANALATGKIGSGFDIAAAVYGHIIYQRYSPNILSNIDNDYSSDTLKNLIKKEWDYKIEHLEIPNMLYVTYANLINDSTSTKSMVSIINKFKEKNPEKYKEIINALDAANRKAIENLIALNNSTNLNENLEQLRYYTELGRHITKELGILSGAEIESHNLSILIDDSKIFGSAFIAKLPGAGGNDAITAICLSKENKAKLMDFWSRKNNLKVLDLDIKDGGYFIEGN